MLAFISHARYPMIIIVATVLLSTLFIITKNNAALNAVAAPTAREVEVMQVRLGLDPEHLAAAGVSTSDAGDVATNLFQAMIDSASQLSAAEDAVANGRRTVSSLTRIVRSGRSTQAQITDLATARSDLATAETALASIMDSMHQSAVTDLSAASKATLATLRNNGKWDMPLEFLAVDRTEAEWVNLRNALANERIAPKLNESVDPGVQTFLASERAVAAVSAAKAGIDANAAAIRTACSNALSN